MNQELIRKIEAEFNSIIGLRNAHIHFGKDGLPYLEYSLSSQDFELTSVKIFGKIKKMIEPRFAVSLEYHQPDALNNEYLRRIEISMDNNVAGIQKRKTLLGIAEDVYYIISHYQLPRWKKT